MHTITKAPVSVSEIVFFFLRLIFKEQQYFLFITGLLIYLPMRSFFHNLLEINIKTLYESRFQCDTIRGAEEEPDSSHLHTCKDKCSKRN